VAWGGSTSVKGSVWGIWDRQGSPYYVDSTIYVDTLKSLEIREGVVFIFNGSYDFKIFGQLVVYGTQTDSVFFWDLLKVNWRGLWFRETSHDCQLDYVSIQKPIWGIRAQYNNPSSALTINNSRIYAQNIAIWSSKAKYTLQNSNLKVDERDATAIDLYNFSDAFIQNCYISAACSTDLGVAVGIHKQNSQPDIIGNTLHVVGLNQAYGIWSEYSYATDLTYNLIQVAAGYFACGAYFKTSSPNFFNNTVIFQSDLANSEGVHLQQNAGPLVNNCIFVGDGSSSIGIVAEPECQPTVKYSDFHNMSTNTIGLVLGEGCIAADPNFVNPLAGDYHIERHSPCHNTGDPARELDPDSTQSDMGCFFFDESATGVIEPNPVIPPSVFYLLEAFPNPFNSQSVIRITLPKVQPGELVVYDQQGRLVDAIKTGMMAAGVSQYAWDASRFSSGVYFIVLRTAGGSYTRQINLVK
jgi:hypothetical protein